MKKSFNNVLKDINDLYNTGNTEEAKELLEKESREFCNDESSKDSFWNNQSTALMEGLVLSILKGNPKETVSLEEIMNILDQALAEGEFSFENYSKAFGELPTKTRISIALLLRDTIMNELKKDEPKVKNKVILGKTGYGKMIRTFPESEFQLQLVPNYVKQLELIVDEQGKRFVRYVDTYGKEDLANRKIEKLEIEYLSIEILRYLLRTEAYFKNSPKLLFQLGIDCNINRMMALKGTLIQYLTINELNIDATSVKTNGNYSAPLNLNFKYEKVNGYVSWIDMLANTICKNFRCIPLYFRPQWRKGKYTEVSVCGLQNDAEICKSVLEYAVKVAEMDCKRIINKMRYEGHSTKNYKNTFMDGFNKGLIEGFYQQIIQDNRYALVVVIPKEVKDHVSTKGNIDLPFNSTESAADEVIKAHGYRRGMEFVDALNNSKKLDERLKIVE